MLLVYGRFVSAVVLLHYLLCSFLCVTHTLSREVICRMSVHAGGWVAGVGKCCESETSCVSPGNVTYVRITLRSSSLAQTKRNEEKEGLSGLVGDAL